MDSDETLELLNVPNEIMEKRDTIISFMIEYVDSYSAQISIENRFMRCVPKKFRRKLLNDWGEKNEKNDIRIILDRNRCLDIQLANDIVEAERKHSRYYTPLDSEQDQLLVRKLGVCNHFRELYPNRKWSDEEILDYYEELNIKYEEDI